MYCKQGGFKDGHGGVEFGAANVNLELQVVSNEGPVAADGGTILPLPATRDLFHGKKQALPLPQATLEARARRRTLSLGVHLSDTSLLGLGLEYVLLLEPQQHLHELVHSHAASASAPVRIAGPTSDTSVPIELSGMK